jgi:hypothetical protein
MTCRREKKTYPWSIVSQLPPICHPPSFLCHLTPAICFSHSYHPNRHSYEMVLGKLAVSIFFWQQQKEINQGSKPNYTSFNLNLNYITRPQPGFFMVIATSAARKQSLSEMPHVIMRLLRKLAMTKRYARNDLPATKLALRTVIISV